MEAPVEESLLPAFELRVDDATGTSYLFNPYTGETVYGITPGAPLPHRRSSFWKPAERDFNEFRTLLRTRAREEARRWGEERSSALTEEQAMAVLVRFARRVVALARIYRRIVEVYDRCLDEQSGFYYYLHRGTQSSQWHKPPGLLPHKDLPLARTDPATLSSLGDGSSSLLPAIKKKRRKGALSEHAAFWGRTPQTQAYHRDRYMNGPIFRRTGYFRDVEMCRVNNLVLDKPFASADKIHRVYKDIDPARRDVGDVIVWEEKYERHEVPIDAYLLCRAAATRGSEVVVRVMKRYPDRRDVQAQGFLQLATFDYPGTKDGASSYKAVEVINASLEVLSSPVEDPPVLLNCLQALAVVSAHYQNRAVLVRKGIIDHVLSLFKKVRKEKITIKVGTEERVIENLSPYHVSIAYYTVKVTGSLAYDDVNREKVTTTCLAGLMHTLKVCADETHVLQEGLLALYNFVFLNEDCHLFLSEHKILKAVKKLIEPFSHDKELMRSGKRCVAALSPNGWRAGLAEC